MCSLCTSWACSKLESSLQAVSIKLVNESHKHAGHYARDGSAASNSGETHFKVEVVSPKFEGLSMVKRHQMVYALLQDEIQNGVHALSMSTKTPKEAEASS
mmetsp:Transcript_40366/g.89633  ORF Transcript_40366/g.89633 Transcript_40366/m.89633 type:complete len:101 (+) Transcript_40366:129-431(+)